MHAFTSVEDRKRKHPEVFDFPYIGHGDPDHTFLHPYLPSPGGDAINGWFQLGSTTVARSNNGRDIVRLTSSSQANQGLIYNSVRTESNNFNGYIDIEMGTVRESHEAADGMGFFFVRDRPSLGSAMGISHLYHGLGIVIDTFSNSRTRRVPYVYAYVSDGVKQWNPDTDGSDTEVTRGCQLEMNTQIRLYIQYVDEELHVGVAMNPRNPHRWHTCFKASNVRLPFSDGGYFAFAGETGHFFALHEVHDAAFVDESAHSGEHFRSDYVPQDYGAGEQHDANHHYDVDHDHDHGYGHHAAEHDYHEHHHHDDGANSNHQSSGYHDQHYDDHQSQNQGQSQGQSHDQSHQSGGKEDVNSEASARVHQGNTATESLSGSLDLQVYEVFNSMTSSLRNMHGKDADEAKLRLDGVRDVAGHLVKEMEKQRAELANVITTLRHLKETSGKLTYASDKFGTQLQALHNSLRLLREKSDDVVSSHDEVHADLIEHSSSQASKKGGNGVMVLFLVVQLLLVSAMFMIYKLSISSRKLGRMV